MDKGWDRDDALLLRLEKARELLTGVVDRDVGDTDVGDTDVGERDVGDTDVGRV
jgi:hypothetical protein